MDAGSRVVVWRRNRGQERSRPVGSSCPAAAGEKRVRFGRGRASGCGRCGARRRIPRAGVAGDRWAGFRRPGTAVAQLDAGERRKDAARRGQAEMWRRVEDYDSIPDKWDTQLPSVILLGGDEPALATAVNNLGQTTAEVVVIPGMDAFGEFAGSEKFDTMVETPFRVTPIQLVA